MLLPATEQADLVRTNRSADVVVRYRMEQVDWNSHISLIQTRLGLFRSGASLPSSWFIPKIPGTVQPVVFGPGIMYEAEISSSPTSELDELSSESLV
jgi:hypothetical protein